MILALDLATNIGVCHGDGHSIPELEHHRLPSTRDEVGPFLVAYRNWVRPLVERVAPTLIVFEAPILPQQTQMATVLKLYGLAGLTEMIAFEEGIACAQATTSAVKKALTGKGTAKKHEMVHWARRYGLEPHTYIKDSLEASDEADAFGVWLAALRARFKDLAPMWEPLIAARVAA